MKNLMFFCLLFLASFAFGQDNFTPSDTYKVVSQENDSTWVVEQFAVYDYTFLVGDVEYPRTDTILLFEETVYLDSAAVIDYLYTTAYNHQQTQSAIISRAFDARTAQREVADASAQISVISGGESDYYEESARRNQRTMVGSYRLMYDSAGVSKNVIAELSLVTNVNHPDGRAYRLTLPNGETFIVRAFSRWNFLIVNWPYSFDRFTWHRSRSTQDRPVYRPDSFINRDDTTTKIIKL